MESQCVLFASTFPARRVEPVPSLSLSGALLTWSASCVIELQGHAIKNQDLLVASGAISLKGSEGLSAVDEDVAAATAVRVQSVIQRCLFGTVV